MADRCLAAVCCTTHTGHTCTEAQGALWWPTGASPTSHTHTHTRTYVPALRREEPCAGLQVLRHRLLHAGRREG